MAAEYNAPGSWNDGHLAQGVYEQLRNATPEGYYLVCDTAFSENDADVGNHIQTPLKKGQRLLTDPDLLQEVMAFTRALLSYRQTAEWGMRQLQGSFGRLRLPLNINEREKCARRLETVFRLNNVQVRRVGISEIRNVYLPRGEGEQLGPWDELGDLLIKNGRSDDRVSRFHVSART